MLIFKKKSTTLCMKSMAPPILRTSAETLRSQYPCQRRSRRKQSQFTIIPVSRRKRRNNHALSIGQLHKRRSTRPWQSTRHPRILALPHGAESFLEAQTANTLIHKKIGDSLKKKSSTFNGGKSDEGAWIANIDTVDAFEVIAKACEEVGNEMDFECGFGLDVAASSFWKPKEEKYVYENLGKKLDTAEQLEFMLELIEKYHLAYVEDPFNEDDFDSFAELTRKAKNCLICGDDLFTTNTERLNNGIKINAGNAIIIKVNQIGTLTDAAETIETAQRHGYDTVVSHRSRRHM